MSGKRLFTGSTPHQITQASEESASLMIRKFTEGELRANSLEDLVQAVFDDKVPSRSSWTSSAIVSFRSRLHGCPKSPARAG
jgi:hypothetical protein